MQSKCQVPLGEPVVRDTWWRAMEVTASLPLMAFESNDDSDRLQRTEPNALQLAQGASGIVGGALGVVGLLLAVLALQLAMGPVIVPAGSRSRDGMARPAVSPQRRKSPLECLRHRSPCRARTRSRDLRRAGGG